MNSETNRNPNQGENMTQVICIDTKNKISGRVIANVMGVMHYELENGDVARITASPFGGNVFYMSTSKYSGRPVTVEAI